MQVPPRCSTFSYRIINESRIIEEERIRQVSVCCDGYEPDIEGEKCAPSCKLRCANGKCNEENKCYCEPGYRGDYCETACDSNRWGRYCRYHCECQQGVCDSNTGRCRCPPGWTGLRCEKPCQPGLYGANCESICECNTDQICDSQDGRCTNKVKVAVLKKYHTFDTNTTTKAHGAKKIDMYLLTTPNSLSPAGIALITTTIKTTTAGGKLNVVNYTDNVSTAQIAAEVKIKSMDRTVMKSDEEISPKEAKAHAEVIASAEDNHQVYNFAAISFLAIVALAASGFLIAVRLLKQKGGEINKSPQETQTKSIFHTPLPEPPQSPFFDSAPCALYHQRIGDNNVVINTRLSFSSVQTTPTLAYIDESNESEVLDACYDQLPSTRGTYKATTAPEPPPAPVITNNPPENDENLYDEIPCWTRSTDNNALYINTRIENKTQF
ncbi:uncharacterized protein [Atheta coriaria]|uniref:uncharacterized protein n=1 Tax=Dalotia coriaria TaxID=877792 RepID=UPI0031F379D4